ncbi:MAG: hypothetical protein M1818_002776 [Claussenomyces sp. TS43310]|nr:MAG: hypothetical protein M1818_002776 [Claussenomyces sp. TS43310]
MKAPGFKYFYYNPSLAAAVVFAVLFIVTTLVHIAYLFKRRIWFFTALIVGGWLESIGYIARIISCKQTPEWTLGPYIISTIFILVAPALLAATIYMILGRVIHVVDGEHLSIIKKKWLTKAFVAGDVTSFLLQAAGGGLMAQATESAVKLGQRIILIGLVLQVLFFGFFIVVSLSFNARLSKFPTRISPSLPWEKHMFILYASSLLIMVRSVFRVVEYIQGNNGYIMDHEVFLYLFDATLMFAVMTLFNVVHPATLLASAQVLDTTPEPVQMAAFEMMGRNTDK